MTHDERCRSCEAKLVPERLELRGEYGSYSVALLGFPLLRCPQGHEAREARAEFMVDLGQELAFHRQLFSKRAGFLSRRDTCRRCGTDLNLNAVVTQRVEVEVEHGGAPPYRVEIGAPLVRCSNCAAPQIPDRVEHYLGVEGALEAAVATADLQYQACCRA